MNSSALAAISLFLFLAASFAFAGLRASQLRIARRANYFANIQPLFESFSSQIAPTGFPRASGRVRGHNFDIQAIPDSLTFRKLPALWVMITLLEDMPVRATLDIMTRPTGQETFSRFSRLPHAIECPDFLPAGSAIRSDDASSVPAATFLQQHAQLFKDPNVKELVVSPQGIRIVILGEEADRGNYLIFRDAETGREPIAPQRVSVQLNAILKLRDHLLDTGKVKT